MSNEAFEKVYGELPHDVDSILNYEEACGHFYTGWKVAKADSAREIAELKKANEWLKTNPRTDIVENYEREIAEFREWDLAQKSKLITQNVRIAELQAHINDLREVLEKTLSRPKLQNEIDDILSSTPAQSLQEHDNEVIEMCAMECETHWDVDSAAEAIRKLKV